MHFPSLRYILIYLLYLFRKLKREKVERRTRVYPRVKESKIHRMAPYFSLSLFFFSFYRFSFILASLGDGKSDKRARSLGADTQVHHEEEGACQVVAGPPLAGWLAGWLPRHSSVNFNVLCHDLSRVSARLSLMLRSIFSPALHPHTRSFRSFTRSLSLFREGLISLLSRIQCGKWTEFAKLGDPDSADSPPQRS